MASAPADRDCTAVWWGHSAATIRLDGVQLVTDPVLRSHIGPLHWVGHRPAAEEVKETDVVLLSHLHRDHTDLPSLRRFGARTTVLVPPGGRSTVRRRLRAAVAELPVGAAHRVGAVEVRSTFAEHAGGRGRRSGQVPAMGFLLLGSRAIYLAGDTDLFEGMRELGTPTAGHRLDLALLPVSGWGLNLGPGHLDPRRAAYALTLLRPRMAIPVHWGRLRIPLLWRTRPGRYRTPATEFAEAARVLAPRCRVLLPEPGQVVPVPATAPA
jgi:L-ascorbate metabolism protein UlaG (beta-lactamase superfamily)